MKLEFSPQIFEKSSNMKFHENCPVGAELLHADMQTRRRKFCERAVKTRTVPSLFHTSIFRHFTDLYSG